LPHELEKLGKVYYRVFEWMSRKNNMNIPQERRKIRPNVEALMNEFKTTTPGGKLKVRGLFKATLFAFNSGIAINFGRIYRFIAQNGLTGEFDPSIPAVLSNVKNITFIAKISNYCA
jgi:hypothetical protein